MSFFGQLLGIAPDLPHVRGSVMTREEILRSLPGVICGKSSYAVLRADYLPGLVDRARTALSRSGGVMRWQPTATCTLFAMNVVSVGAQEYFEASWHDTSPAAAPALGWLWYRPDGAPFNHARAFAFTDRGLLFLEPQATTRAASIVTLSVAEQASRYASGLL